MTRINLWRPDVIESIAAAKRTPDGVRRRPSLGDRRWHRVLRRQDRRADGGPSMSATAILVTAIFGGFVGPRHHRLVRPPRRAAHRRPRRAPHAPTCARIPRSVTAWTQLTRAVSQAAPTSRPSSHLRATLQATAGCARPSASPTPTWSTGASPAGPKPRFGPWAMRQAIEAAR